MGAEDPLWSLSVCAWLHVYWEKLNPEVCPFPLQTWHENEKHDHLSLKSF